MRVAIIVMIGAFGFALVPTPVFATQITMDFSGSVNLSSFVGGPSSNTFAGSVTWDTTTAAQPGSTPTVAVYHVVSESFVLDGTDYSADALNRLVDVENDDGGEDVVSVILQFGPSGIFSPPTVSGIGSFIGEVIGPTSMFASDALPSDLSFLSDVTTTDSFFQGLSNEAAKGTLNAATPTAAPEPASLLLLGTGLIGAAAFRRRTRRQRD